MKRSMTLLITAAMLIVFTQVKAQEGNMLTVLVENFDDAQGTIKIGLYNSEETYMGKSFKSVSSEVDNTKQVKLVFENIPNGQYTFSMYHDLNGNGQLDKNFLGIPSEDYAFSNNADGRFGPPEYAECVFEINEKETIQTIKLN